MRGVSPDTDQNIISDGYKAYSVKELIGEIGKKKWWKVVMVCIDLRKSQASKKTKNKFWKICNVLFYGHGLITGYSLLGYYGENINEIYTMKKILYIVLDGLGDGHYPCKELGNLTPLEAAETPTMDMLAKRRADRV